MNDNDIEIIVIGVRSWAKKGTSDRYYVIDFYKTSNFIPKTDFINAIEFNQIAKKLNNKHSVLCIGHRKPNDYDNLYVYDIDVKDVK